MTSIVALPFAEREGGTNDNNYEYCDECRGHHFFTLKMHSTADESRRISSDVGSNPEAFIPRLDSSDEFRWNALCCHHVISSRICPSYVSRMVGYMLPHAHGAAALIGCSLVKLAQNGI